MSAETERRGDGSLEASRDAAVAELRAKGAEFAVEPHSPRPGFRLAFVRAPDGVRVDPRGVCVRPANRTTHSAAVPTHAHRPPPDVATECSRAPRYEPAPGWMDLGPRTVARG